MANHIKTAITKDGQRYVDEPIVVHCKHPAPSPIAIAIQAAFDPKGRFAERPHPPITVGHNRVLLRWMTPDGKGGLKPRER